MKKSVKIALIVSVTMIFSGLLMLFAVLWSLSFDFSKLDYTAYNNVEYKVTVYDIDYDFNDVYIDEKSLDIYFDSTSEEKAYVRVLAQENIKHQVFVENEKLIVKRTDDSLKNSVWGINIGTQTPRLTVYLPKKNFENLTINSTSGDIYIYDNKNFSFKNCEISANSSDVDVLGFVTDSLTVNTTSGKIGVGFGLTKNVTLSSNSGDVYLQKLKDSHDINIKTTSGDIYVSLVQCDNLSVESNSGEQKCLNTEVANLSEMHSTSGDITLEAFDSGESNLWSTSGTIYGEFLTSKNFITFSESGTINAPIDGTGGNCLVRTYSGDITLKLSK